MSILNWINIINILKVTSNYFWQYVNAIYNFFEAMVKLTCAHERWCIIKVSSEKFEIVPILFNSHPLKKEKNKKDKSTCLKNLKRKLIQ